MKIFASTAYAPEDSYFSTIAVVTHQQSIALASPGFDPATGQMSMVANSPPVSETWFLEGGYTSSGAAVLQGVALADAITDPQPDDARGFRFIDESLTLFDRQGNPQPVSPETNADVQEARLAFGDLRTSVFELIGPPPGDGPPGGGNDSTFFARASDEPSRRTMRRGSDWAEDEEIEPTSSGDSTRREMRRTRGWTRRGAEWYLSTVTLEERSTRQGRTSSVRAQIRFSETKGRRNAARDAARRQAQSAPRVGQVVPVASSNVQDCSPMFARGELSNCFGGGTTPGSQPGYQCPDNQSLATGAPQADHANVVFQHGIWSNACMWDVARAQLRMGLRLGRDIATRTGNTQGYGVQATQMLEAFGALRGNASGFVAIGHSQGGLVARLVAQTVGPAAIRGIITVNSPNQGALIAETWRQAPASAVVSRGRDSYLARRYVAGGRAGRALDVLFPFIDGFRCEPSKQAMCDARPGSGMLNQINGASGQVTTVAIVGLARHDLSLFRLAGDNFSADGIGGRSLTQQLRNFRVWGTGLGLILPGARGPLLGAAAAITTADLSWRAMYANGEGGDGFIPANRQPAPVANSSIFTVLDADSHVGATKGIDRGIRAIRDKLFEDFGVLTR